MQMNNCYVVLGLFLSLTFSQQTISVSLRGEYVVPETRKLVLTVFLTRLKIQSFRAPKAPRNGGPEGPP